MPQSTFYVTTPIYYVNGVPHLGTAYCTTACDCLARWHRMDGDDVHFLTGLDEHGQKVAESAEAHGMDPQAWCDSLAPQFIDTWKSLDITNDDFIRTTQDRHLKGVQRFCQELLDRGFLYKAAYEGWYCVHEETYYTESEILEIDGEKCCPECRRPLRYEADGEENWFFKLSEFEGRLLDYYEEHPDFISPTIRRNEVVSFVKSGLKDLSISRSTFDWGVPLPFDEGHVAYVWADALINYITAIGYGADDAEGAETFQRYWPADVHVVGKDIIRFHCVIWPAMLVALDLPLPKKVFAHGFLLTKGAKMSKSTGNAVMPLDLCNIFGIDGYRYYYMSDVQFGADGDISLERMVQVYNADLANSYGNLVSRVTNMCGKYFDGRVPEVPTALADAANPLRDIAEGLYGKYRARMEEIDFSGAIAAVHELVDAANLYVEQSSPWVLAKDEAKVGELAFVIYNLLEACRLSALFYTPFMPNTSAEVYRRFHMPGNPADMTQVSVCSEWGRLSAGQEIAVGDALFPRLKDEDVSLEEL